MGISKEQLIRVIDKILSRKVNISIGDIMRLQNNDIEYGQFTVVSRLLDIKGYYQNTIPEFKYQNEIGYACWGTAHDKEIGNEKFKNIIISYAEKGLIKNNSFFVSKTCRLIDGTHRLALNIYHGIMDAPAVEYIRVNKYISGIEWAENHNLPSWLIKDIKNEFFELQNLLLDCGESLCFVIKAKHKEKAEALYSEMQKKVDVDRKYCFQDSDFFYVIAQFHLNNPKYYFSRNGVISSKYIEEINKELIKKAYNKADILELKISSNCIEGKSIYLEYKNRFVC